MEQTGVLLVNLGTTSSPDPKAIRVYLKEFLSDRFVIDKPPWPIWWLILHLAILPRRPQKIAPQYRNIWMPEGAPLVVYTQRQRDALEPVVGMPVGFGMRYGRPSILDGLRSMVARGCTRIVLVPMFPQESKATWGTAVHLAQQHIRDWMGGSRPELRVVDPFFAHPGYVGPIATMIREEMERAPADHVLFSYHGIPERFVEEGDPYQGHCEATTAAVVAALGLSPSEWTHAYQSRFGKEKWLGPPTDETVVKLAATHKRVIAVTPGFPADCLETIEEIGDAARESFLHAGGEDFRLVPGLNDHPAWIKGLAEIAKDAP